MIDAQKAREAIHERLEDFGWETNVTYANYTRKGHALEFKVGTMYGEVTVHVRDRRIVTETIRVVNDEQLQDLLSRIEDLAHESEAEVAMGAV